MRKSTGWREAINLCDSEYISVFTKLPLEMPTKSYESLGKYTN